jgi:hypothetical protein
MGGHETSDEVTGVWLRTATTGVAHMVIWGISVASWVGLGTTLPGTVWAAGRALACVVALVVVGWRWVSTRQLDLGMPAGGGAARGFRGSLLASWPLLVGALGLGALMSWLAARLPIRGVDVVCLAIAVGVCAGGLCADRIDRRRGVVVVRREGGARGCRLMVLARVGATS